MTVDELRHLLSQGRRFTDEAVLRGVERLAEEHLGRLTDALVADELPRCLNQVRLIRRDLEAGGAGAVDAARTSLRVLKARTAYSAAPRESGARVGREYKELIDACLAPLLIDCSVAGIDDLTLFLETLRSYAHFHHQLARARRRSELRKRRREEQAGPRPGGEPVRGPGPDGGGASGPPRGDRSGRRDRRRRRPEHGPGAGSDAPADPGAVTVDSGAAPTPADAPTADFSPPIPPPADPPAGAG